MINLRNRVALLTTLPLIVVPLAYSGHKPARTADLLNNTVAEMTITMDGASQRPTKVITDATGTAKFSWAGTGPISYVITVKKLSGVPTGAHIHGPADAETAAGVLVPFKLDSVIPNGTIATGSIGPNTRMSITLDSLKKLMSSGHAYVNVHTAKNPAGEIRGQFK